MPESKNRFSLPDWDEIRLEIPEAIKNISQKEIARMFKMHPQHINYYLKGTRNITLRRIAELAYIFKCHPYEFMPKKWRDSYRNASDSVMDIHEGVLLQYLEKTKKPLTKKTLQKAREISNDVFRFYIKTGDKITAEHISFFVDDAIKKEA